MFILSEVLRNIAVLIKDSEIVNQIDTFEEKSQVANFPYKVLLNNLEETIKLKQKQKVEKAMRIERQRIEENLQSLQNKLLRDLKYSNLVKLNFRIFLLFFSFFLIIKF